ncbi:MAG: insulinase family protein, partial [Defluviitaleaceae bacterium]|nr:insulinase family protein [Defluviitaleaceae bacterium]
DAQIIKKGEQQILQFFLECIDGDDTLKSRGLDFLHEIILSPRVSGHGFYDPYVMGEIENLKNRIEGRINNKSEYTKSICLEAMCENEPFGIYGDGYLEDLSEASAAITAEGLLDHYHDVLAHSPIDFIALGRWDENWLKKQLDMQLGYFSSGRVDIPHPALKPARADRQIIQLDHGTAQGNLCIGLRGKVNPVGKEFIHFQLANEILGSGPNAKLFVNIREKESLCYAIYSSIYRFKSLMCIQAGTEPDKLEHVMALAEKEVDALKQGHFSEAELHSARQSLAKRWRAMQDNPSACVDFYASQYLLGDTHTLDELLTQVENASRSGVTQAAAQLNIDTAVMMR